MRLSMKLMLGAATVMVVVGLLLNLFFGRTIETFLLDQAQAGLLRQIRLAGLYVGDRLAYDDPDQLAGSLSERLEVRVTLVDELGSVIGDSSVPTEGLSRLDNHAERPEIAQARDGGFGRSVRFSDTIGIDMLYVAGPVADHKGIILRLALPMGELAASRTAVQGTIVAVLALGFIGVQGIAYGFSRLLTRHVRDLTHDLRQIAEGEPEGRPRGSKTPELGALATALDDLRTQMRERIERILAESSRVEVVLASLSESILVTEKDGRIRMTNDRFSQLFGLGFDVETAGRLPIDYVQLPDVQDTIEQSLRDHEERTLEVVLPGVVERYLDVHIAPILQSGSCIGSVTVFYDVSEARRLEQVRKDFVANVSHELRTPLTAIKGCAATLAEGALEDGEAAERFVASINTHAERLHLLLDDLLELSRLESGRLEIDVAQFDLAETVDAAIDTVRALATEKDTEVIPVVASTFVLIGDRGLVQQVLVNLLENAIRYSDEGSRVVVTAGRAVSPSVVDPRVPFASPDLPANVKPSGNGPRVFVEVSDNGPGIPEDDLPRLFERFYRVEKARSRPMGGTGLGLSIVKHIMEAHKERVYVRSELGRGAVFGFSLPVADG